MKKYFDNIREKLKEIKATPYEIAAGFACGVAVSFTPFVGFHSILAMSFAFCIRASIIAALIGTLFGNPWTFPFIWIMVLYVGELFLRSGNHQTEVDFEAVFFQAFDMLKNCNFDGFLRDVWPVLYPMIIGSIPFCLLSWIITYIIAERMIKKSRG